MICAWSTTPLFSSKSSLLLWCDLPEKQPSSENIPPHHHSTFVEWKLPVSAKLCKKASLKALILNLEAEGLKQQKMTPGAIPALNKEETEGTTSMISPETSQWKTGKKYFCGSGHNYIHLLPPLHATHYANAQIYRESLLHKSCKVQNRH